MKNLFPNTIEHIESTQRRMQLMQERLFPMLPQEGSIYEAEVQKPFHSVNMESSGYQCLLRMKPFYYFLVTDPNYDKKDQTTYPKKIYARCINAKERKFELVEKTEGEIVYSFS